MNPGADFEDAVQRSFGTKGSPDPPAVYVRKLPKPPVRRPDQQETKGEKQKVRFSSPQPYDFLVMWPRGRTILLAAGHPAYADGGAPSPIPDGCHCLALELKSTAVPRLEFSVLWSKSRGKLRAIQRDALAAVARAGGFAGVLWEYRETVSRFVGAADAVTTHRAVFIPIASWLAWEADPAAHGCNAKSIPWAVAVRDGIVVERDGGRGTKKPYWRMPGLLRALEGGRRLKTTQGDRLWNNSRPSSKT